MLFACTLVEPLIFERRLTLDLHHNVLFAKTSKPLQPHVFIYEFILANISEMCLKFLIRLKKPLNPQRFDDRQELLDIDRLANKRIRSHCHCLIFADICVSGD
jgi:hypothetical protein